MDWGLGSEKSKEGYKSKKICVQTASPLLAMWNCFAPPTADSTGEGEDRWGLPFKSFTF